MGDCLGLFGDGLDRFGAVNGLLRPGDVGKPGTALVFDSYKAQDT